MQFSLLPLNLSAAEKTQRLDHGIENFSQTKLEGYQHPNMVWDESDPKGRRSCVKLLLL